MYRVSTSLGQDFAPACAVMQYAQVCDIILQGDKVIYGGISSTVSYFRPHCLHSCLHLELWSTLVDDGGCDETETEDRRAHLIK